MEWNSLFGNIKASESSEQAPKRQAVQAKVDDKQNLALKMAVMNAAKSRQTKAASGLREVPLEEAGEHCVAVKQAITEYGNATRGNKGHKLGTRETYAFAAFVWAVQSKAKKNGEGELVQWCQNILDTYKPGTKTAQRFVKVCTLEKMHDSKYKRLLLAVRSTDVEDRLLDALETQGGQPEWYGQEPPGWLERRATELLQA